MKNKKEYLNTYMLQASKIRRLNEMIKLSPADTDEYKKQIEKCDKLRREIEEKILAVDDGILSEVLFHKYICGRTIEEISYIINYSIRQTERFHLKALEKFKI